MEAKNLWAVLLALLLVAAACGSDSDDGTTAAPGGGTGGDGGEDTADTTPVDSSELDQEATFRYAYTVGPSRFDPHKASSSFDNTTLFPTYDRLVHMSPDADPIPGLAESWELSEDGTTLTLDLRQGVTFHDGEPFDAEAVRANLERAMTVEGSVVAGELDMIQAVEVVDEHTVALALSGSGGALINILSDRAGMMISPAAFDNPDLDQAPVGAGMFRVAEYSPNNLIVYERYEDYWDPEAVNVARFELSILADPTTRMNAVQTGAVDATFLDANQRPEAEAAGLNIQLGSGLAYYHVQLNRARSEFGDVRVRQAMNHAIDREGILQGLLFGLGELSSQPFPEGYWANNPDIPAELYPYDPDRARELLAEAGLAGGFEFDFLVPTIPNIVELGEAVQSQLAEVGIVANIRQIEPAQTADIFYAQQDGDALVSPWGGRPDPTQTVELMFSSTGFSNPGRHSPEGLDALIAESAQSADTEERAEVFHEIDRIIADEALDVIIYFPTTPTVFNDRVVGLQSYVTGKPEFRGVGMLAE